MCAAALHSISTRRVVTFSKRNGPKAGLPVEYSTVHSREGLGNDIHCSHSAKPVVVRVKRTIFGGKDLVESTLTLCEEKAADKGSTECYFAGY